MAREEAALSGIMGQINYFKRLVLEPATILVQRFRKELDDSNGGNPPLQCTLRLPLILRWQSLIHPRNAATYPAATLYSDCGRGLVPKDASRWAARTSLCSISAANNGASAINCC